MTNKRNDFLFDERILRRNIKAGRIKREEFQSYLESLPDLDGQFHDIGEEVFQEGSSAKVSVEYLGSENDDFLK